MDLSYIRIKVLWRIISHIKLPYLWHFDLLYRISILNDVLICGQPIDRSLGSEFFFYFSFFWCFPLNAVEII